MTLPRQDDQAVYAVKTFASCPPQAVRRRKQELAVPQPRSDESVLLRVCLGRSSPLCVPSRLRSFATGRCGTTAKQQPARRKTVVDLSRRQLPLELQLVQA